MEVLKIKPHNFYPKYIEKYQLAEVVNLEVVQPEEIGISPDNAPGSISRVRLVDPYVEYWSFSDLENVKSQEREADSFAATRRNNGYWERRPGTAYIKDDESEGTKHVWGDPVSGNLFFNKMLGSDGIIAWRSKIPSAKALLDLSDPIGEESVTDKKGRSVERDETAKKWLSLCTDARAIRSRAAVMAQIVSDYALSNTGTNKVNWLSVACGTALPAMQGAIKAGISPRLFLADYDEHAMASTELLGREIGFSGEIILPNAVVGSGSINIFDENVMKNLGDTLRDTDRSPDLMDLMGIFEYTGEDLGVDSVKFLKSCYDILAPGGKLIFGQMRSDRPFPDFVMGVVGWPFIKMRSPNEFMQIIQETGISSQNTDIYLPEDGVYTVGVITKQ